MLEKEPKYHIEYTSIFRKDLKKAKKRGLNISLLDDIVTALQYGEKLPEKNKDHALTGNWIQHRESQNQQQQFYKKHLHCPPLQQFRLIPSIL